MKRFFQIVCLFAAIGFGLVAFQACRFLYTPASTETTPIYFEVKPGPFSGITKDLVGQGLISNGSYFTWLARVKKQATKVKTGEYELRADMKPAAILDTIVSGKMVQHEFTVQEGLNIYEIADVLVGKKLIDRQEFLRLCKNKKFIQELLGESLSSIEGYLFPDTYRVTKYQGARSIIKTMVEKFNEVYKDVLENSKFPSRLNSRHEIVIMASMIEKETGAGFERPVIGSVFVNRLNKKMRLQSDPTILYGIMERDGKWKKNIQKKDIQTKTPYNTYRVNGLPLGPIANPGRESLKAVFAPSDTPYLYFVSKNDGTHYFSKTYKEHRKAVRDYQMNAKARKGKSWRDLKQKAK